VGELFRLPLRISVKLKNSSQLPAFAIRPEGQGKQKKITIERMALLAKVGEWCAHWRKPHQLLLLTGRNIANPSKMSHAECGLTKPACDY